MTQTEIDRGVRSVTGESLKEVRRRGFSEADPLEVDFDPEPYSAPGIVDWDELQSCRVAIFPNRRPPVTTRL